MNVTAASSTGIATLKNRNTITASRERKPAWAR